MGTVITLVAHNTDDALVDRFFARIRELETLLSRFRADSDISLIADSSLSVEGADPRVQEVLRRCDDLRQRTDGFFEHEPRSRTGRCIDPVLDPNALAKGWIVEEAAKVLREAGVEDFFINAGGDVLARRPRTATAWRAGVQHPDDPSSVVAIFEMFGGAIATTGTYERGQHIWSLTNPELRSVTVTGPDLAEADGLATAVFATGQLTPEWWGNVDPEYGLLVMSIDGSLRWRPPLVDETAGQQCSAISLVAGL